jgi:hypothetical protein
VFPVESYFTSNTFVAVQAPAAVTESSKSYGSVPLIEPAAYALPPASTATEAKVDAALAAMGVWTHSGDRATLFTVFDALAVAVVVCVPVVDGVPVVVGVVVAVLVAVLVRVAV